LEGDEEEKEKRWKERILSGKWVTMNILSIWDGK
jgi:hypothetical protein